MSNETTRTLQPQPPRQQMGEMLGALQQSPPVQQLKPDLSPQAQEAIALLNIRVNDLLTQLNIVLNLLVKENAELKQQIAQQQKTKQTKPLN